MAFSSRAGALVLALAALAAGARAAERLPALGAAADRVTVSGISSGGYMAVQFHVAHSARVDGAGVLAGGPYLCAGGSAFTAYYNCMRPGSWTPLPEVRTLGAATEALAAAGRIDPVAGLARSRVWLFSGTRDDTVRPVVVDALAAYYRQFVPAAAVARVADRPAGHAMVTENAGAACGVTAPPFINACDFDAAGVLLAHLVGPLAAPVADGGRLVAFDQREFTGGDAYAASLDDTGWLFVPAACERERCRVHVAYHGCRQGREAVGEAYVNGAGYNRWAAANRLVVLYPQAIARYGWGVGRSGWSYAFNPNGCWDWWGYTGAGYATRDGAQIRAVRAMLDRLAAPR